MKSLLPQLLLIFLFLAPQLIFCQNEVLPEDLALVLGKWEGKLTYMDYSTNKPYTMPTNALIEKGKNGKQLIIQFTYPNEPKANSKGKITVSKDGLSVNKAEVISKQELENNETQIVTQSSGKDDNKKALIRHTYIIGSNRFISRKEVKFENNEDWIMRNEYQFLR